MAIDWTPARLEVDLNYKSKDIILASEWNNLWKETRLQGNNNTDGIVLLIETVEGNIGHLTNLDNLFADLESKVTAHTGNSDIHVTSTQKTAWTAKYEKPSGGIPKTDLASAVQSSLDKADSALQQHQDISALTAHVANSSIHVTPEQKTAWTAKYDKAASGIPKSDLASAVQASLNKADTALQEHQDISALTTHVANNSIHVTADNKNAWNAKYNKPSSGIPKTDLASDIQTSLAKADASAEAFLVTFTPNQGTSVFTADKTYAEIVAAYESGKIVRCSVANAALGQLVNVGNGFINFSAELFTGSASAIYVFTINSANEVNLRIIDYSSLNAKTELFNIEVSEDRGTGAYVSDKTFDEILVAYNDNKILKLYLYGSGGIFDSYLSSSNRFKFVVPTARSIVYITPSAITVEDSYLYLPFADALNKGNVLTVDSSGNPAWAEATPSGSSGVDSFLVTFTFNEESGELSKDKTYAEIIAAYEAGKTVLCKYLAYGDVQFGQLVNILSSTNTVSFTVGIFEQAMSAVFVFTVNSSNEVSQKMIPYYSSEFSQYTIPAAGWNANTKVYSFEANFPNGLCDIEIELDSTATESQVEAWSSAKPTAVFGTNKMKALGDVPTVDIPVIVKKVDK